MKKKDVEINNDLDVEHFESVDQIVSSQLATIQSDSFDPKVLLAIYNNLW